MKRKFLPDVCKIQYGFPFDASRFSASAGTPLARIRDVARGYSETCTDEPCGAEYVIRNGDILIGMDGAFHIARWRGGEALLNQRVCKLSPVDVDGGYLVYYLSGVLKRIEDETPFVTVKHLSAKRLNEIEMNLPDATEQRRIASSLGQVDALMDLRKRQLDKLDELIKAQFAELFDSNQEKAICALSQLANVGSSKRVFVHELKNDGIPFFRGTEVGMLAEGKPITPEFFISEERYHELKKATGIPAIGDLLLPSICPDGRIWQVNSENPFYFKDGRVLWIHINSQQLNSTYLLYALKNIISREYSNLASGTTFMELKIFALQDLRIALPPLRLQERFAAFVERSDKSKLAIRKGLNKLETLKAALMQQYFG